jgi:histidinol-phosphate aminotransferase
MSQEILNNVRKNLFDIDPYVPGKPISEVKKEYGLSDVTKLASNENPLGPSKRAQEAIIAALPDLHRYPDGGAVTLKEALCHTHGVAADQILVGNGSDEVIKLISETFLDPGDEVVIPTPTFSQYWFGAQVMGASSVIVPLQENFEYDLEAMLAAVTEKTKLVYLCTPNNPTGTYIKKDDLKSFLDRLPKHVLVALDEAYEEYVVAEDAAHGIDFLKAGYNVLVMRTFSKLYALAALRVGYTLGLPEVIHSINRAREPFNVNHMAQVAAVAALQDEEHTQASRDVNRAGYQQLTDGLAALGFSVVPTQANFLIFDTGVNDKELFQALLREGVIVRSGTALGVPGYLRISIGTSEENAKFLATFAKVLPQFKQQV